MSTLLRMLIVLAVLIASMPRFACACQPEATPNSVQTQPGCPCDHPEADACCCDHGADEPVSHDGPGPHVCAGAKTKVVEKIDLFHGDAHVPQPAFEIGDWILVAHVVIEPSSSVSGRRHADSNLRATPRSTTTLRF